MPILGLNFGHDGAAAVVRDNTLVSAVSLERINRKKKASGVTLDLIQYVLDAASLRLEEIEAVAFAAYIHDPEGAVRLFLPDGREVKNHIVDLFGGQSHVRMTAQIGGRSIPAFFVQHHLAHCAAAFFTSPFERAACFSVDASERHPEACSVFAYGDGNSLRYLRCPGAMIGNAYSSFTERLGLGPGLTKAGTMMGLAPYGEVIKLTPEQRSNFTKSFYSREYQPADNLFINQMWSTISGLPPHQGILPEQSDSRRAMDIAATIQSLFEESLTNFARGLHRESHTFSDGNLCLGGGSFLNSETNMTIATQTSWSNVHLFPACGDDGTAAGAALYVAHVIGNAPRRRYTSGEIAYLGKRHIAPDLTGRFTRPYVPQQVAQLLASGKIIAWYQGRSEFGPRALGNRSILADPRRPDIRDTINRHVKKREWFRPFAPSVLAAAANDWFELPFASPFMLFIGKVRRPESVPAISHIDSTARVQTVTHDDNPHYHELITNFASETEVPMVLNTSLNGNDEPLAEKPEDALRFLDQSPIDFLAMPEYGVVVGKQSFV